MKKVISLLLPVLFLSLVFTSCDEQVNVEKNIIGKWTIESAEFVNLDDLVKEMSKVGGLMDVDIDQFKQGLDADMKSDFEGSIIEFFEDKTVKIGDSEKSTWEYDNKNKKLIVKEFDDMVYHLFVENISEKNLKIKMVISQNGFDYEIRMKMTKK